MKRQIVDDHPDVKTDKIEVIENGFDPEDFSNITKKKANQVKIFHFGTLTQWRSPKNLFAALRELQQNETEVFESLSVNFMGNVPVHYQNMAKDFAVNRNIEFSGFFSYNEGIKKLVSEAEVGLIILGDLDVNTNMLTSKVFDYIGAKIPLLVLAGEGELKDFVKKYNLGLVCDPDDINEIKLGLQHISENYSAFTEKITFSGLEGFQRRHLAQKLAHVLEGTLN